MKKLIFLAWGLFLSSGCSIPNKLPFTNYTVFTEELRKDLEGAGIALDKVQFYNDKPITIKREGVDPNDINVSAEGKISVQNGKSVQTIGLKPFTPGVVMGDSTGAINVTWDNTRQDETGIRFILSGNQYFLQTTQDSKLPYKGFMYDVQSGVGSRLFVNKDLLKQVKNERETLKGRKVGDGSEE